MNKHDERELGELLRVTRSAVVWLRFVAGYGFIALGGVLAIGLTGFAQSGKLPWDFWKLSLVAVLICLGVVHMELAKCIERQAALFARHIWKSPERQDDPPLDKEKG